MKLFSNHTIPIILPNGKNILVDIVFKISKGYTNLDCQSTGLYTLCKILAFASKLDW